MASKLDIRGILADKIVTLVVPPEGYEDIRYFLLEEMYKMSRALVFVSMNLPPSGISLPATTKKKAILVDATSPISGGQQPAKAPSVFSKVHKVSNPSALEDISYEIKKAVGEAGGNSTLLYDSLTTP